MKIENNCALAAEKKTYDVPSVIVTQMVRTASVLMASEPLGLPIGESIDGGGD